MIMFTEDKLVQKTMAEYLEKELGWESVYAFNDEVLGSDGTFGRKSEEEVVLTRYLRKALVKFNPGLPEGAYDSAVRLAAEYGVDQSLIYTNRDKHNLLINGVKVSYKDHRGQMKKKTLRIFDFENPEENSFLCVRELWVKGSLYRRRPDIIGFVNGIPLLFIECKNVSRNIRVAYEENLSDYKDTIPHLFHHNAFIVLANGISAKVGTVSGRYEHFGEWKRLSEEEQGSVDTETLLKGICDKRNFMDLFENFIVFDDSSGKTVKILARNHQYLGVNRAIESVVNRRELMGKLGVFWHTQGSGKSYSMVFFTRKIHRKIGANFTFLILTDREDLDNQIYKTFAGCGLTGNQKSHCRAASGEDLQKLLKQQKKFVFSLIQKFNVEVDPKVGYSQRDDIIVISDEAHRTQYGILALNMRSALPNASLIGFTGTPLFKEDEITRKIFGDYVSTYDFQRAVEDNATVPLYYDARGDKLNLTTTDINRKILEKIEEMQIDDIDVQQKIESELNRDYHIITAEKRLEQIAKDFCRHYSKAWESGKAMFICIDKKTCVRMYKLIDRYWKKEIRKLESARKKSESDQEEIYLERQIDWMKKTQMAVVVSEEQGEVDKFRREGLDIIPHRSLLKQGFEIPAELRDEPEFQNIRKLDVDDAFKEARHPFRIAIVCAMWLTGFDVPSLSTLYLDKPLKAHTLMQTIARANRVYEGKNNGLIVDYCGILKNLRKALALYAAQGDDGRPGENKYDPTKPQEELLDELVEAIEIIETYLEENGASLKDIFEKEGFERLRAIEKAKEAANINDKSRKRFEIMCRVVFRKFRASLNVDGINELRPKYKAVDTIYKSLQSDREKADIGDIIYELHKIVDESIDTVTPVRVDSDRVFDISRIDFEKLKSEFASSKRKNSTVQDLNNAIEQRLNRMLARNPLRIKLQKRYEEIVEEYNSEKDRVTIEQTFEKLLKFINELSEEEQRAIKEGLDEESLAIYDLLLKPDLKPAQIRKIKEIAQELLDTLKNEKLKIDHWREKQATKDSVKKAIYDFLYSEETGLPEPVYSINEIRIKTDQVFEHIYRVYPTLPSPYFVDKIA